MIITVCIYYFIPTIQYSKNLIIYHVTHCRAIHTRSIEGLNKKKEIKNLFIYEMSYRNTKTTPLKRLQLQPNMPAPDPFGQQ